ncbi:MAG: thermostable hemolysin [Candidatus Thiodiazotropha sp. (ex Lucinoma kastoroae)]|nr:thermostable hemolysin [Candidatus Thiodiazotropha sp. (ex Lucinoma kastoroae)]
MLSARKRKQEACSPPTDVHTTVTGSRRRAAEDFVCRCFDQFYNAEIGNFIPLLMGLSSVDGVLQAVLGLRPAGEERLFLETSYIEG